jgi:hypothetical protein
LAWKRGEGNTIGDVVVTFARSGVLSEGPEGLESEARGDDVFVENKKGGQPLPTA